MKQQPFVFTIIAVLGDLILGVLSIILGVIFAQFIQVMMAFGTDFATLWQVMQQGIVLEAFQDLRLIGVVTIFFVLPFYFANLYSLSVTRSIIPEWRRLFSMIFFGIVILFVLFSIIFGTPIEPYQMVLTGASFYILMVVWRYLLRWLQRLAVRIFDAGIQRVAIIDDVGMPIAEAFARDIQRAPWLGYRLVGQYNSPDLKLLDDLHKTQSIDILFHVSQEASDKDRVTLLDFSERRKIQYRYVPSLMQAQTSNVTIESLAGYPVVAVNALPLARLRNKVFKRLFDFVFGLIALILSSPIYIIVGLVVALTSRGSVIFKNKRIGFKRRVFSYYKFRSMKMEHSTSEQNPDHEKALEYEKELIAEKNTRGDGPLYKVADDPRLTSVGGFLRRWSFDEFPSFLNVVLGHLSLVGPRPHQPREVQKYPEGYDKLFMVKPGVTGLAQVSGRSDLSFEEEVRLDLYYIENWSFWKDIVLLLKTPLAVFGKRRAK